MPEKIFNKKQYFLSFLLPIVLKRETTRHQVLELALEYGKLSVNSKNVNYSFGENHSAWEEVLTHQQITSETNVLILGFGTGSIAEILFRKFQIKKILGIELDGVLIEWAKTFFRDKFPKETIIKKEDAFQFIENSQAKFDRIFTDLFIDKLLPEKLLSEKTLEKMLLLLRPQGKIIINTLFMDAESRKQNLRFREILSLIPNVSVTSFYYKKHEFFILSL